MEAMVEPASKDSVGGPGLVCQLARFSRGLGHRFFNEHMLACRECCGNDVVMRSWWCDLTCAMSLSSSN